MTGAHNSTRNKTSSQRGLSDLLRNQNGNAKQKISNYHQNKFQRVQSNTNATIENRSAAGPHLNARNATNAGYATNEKTTPQNQGQKLQNNFFFQPSSPRESAENLQLNNEVSPQGAIHGEGGYSHQRNIRTAAGGPRQRMIANQNQTQPVYHQLQIQTSNNANMMINPNQTQYGQHPQTT